jgi:hypothetical protein
MRAGVGPDERARAARAARESVLAASGLRQGFRGVGPIRYNGLFLHD